MNHPVRKLGLLATIPPFRRSDEVTGDALQHVQVLGPAPGATLQSLLGRLIAAVQATDAVMVNAAITHIILHHQVYDPHDGLGVMGGVAIHLDIEDMPTPRQFMIRAFTAALPSGEI